MRETDPMSNLPSNRRGHALFLAVAVVLAAIWDSQAAANWPQFRGPNCSGVSDADKPPIEFGPSTHLLWKIELPPGLSSPCIWGDRMFLTGVADQKVNVLCV